MKPKLVQWLWGGGLIVLGGLLLLQNVGVISNFPATTWVILLGALSLLFFTTYFIQGKQEFGWLFPAFIMAGVAVTILLGDRGYNEAWVGMPVLASVALPFYCIFALNRSNWWALIPAWVMTVIAMITLIADRMPGEVIGAMVLFSIGVPFLVVFLKDRRNWWALIPAFAMIAIGFIPLLASQPASELIGAYVLFAISLPFFVVYFWSKENWWAFIPAGVMASIGLMVLLLTSGVVTDANFGFANGILFLGMAVSFAFLWLRRKVHPTDWAIWPAIGTAVVGGVSFLFSNAVEIVGPVMIIAAGVVVLYFTLRPRKNQ
jgi:hypothetical protein